MRKTNRKPDILALLSTGGDPINIAQQFGVTPSYVYRLDRGRREGENFEHRKKPSGAPLRLPVGSMFSELSVSSLIRHGGDIYEEYLRELRGYSGVQLYKEMGNHPVVAAVLSAVKMTLRRVGWFAVGNGSKQREAVDFLDSVMDDMSITWSDYVDQALSMLQFGFAPFEVVWKIRRGRGARPGPRVPDSRYNDGLIGWRKFAFIGQDTLVPGNSWAFDKRDGSLQGLNQQPPPGAEIDDPSARFIPIEKMILFRTTTERNNPEGRSLLRAMYAPWFYAKNLTEVEAIASERMGAGFPVFYLGEDVGKGSTSETEINEFRVISRNIRVDEQMGLVIPYPKMGSGAREGQGVLFEFASPTSRGVVNFNEIIQRHEKRIAMTGLAQFVHLGMDNIGSQALASVTTDFFQLAVAAWADALRDTINRFAVDRLFALNGKFDSEDHPIIEHSDISTPDLKTVGDYINKTVGAQVITPDDNLEEALRRVGGFPSRDTSTLRRVMVETDGDGGERVSREEKSRPTNQRNTDPGVEEPQEPEKPSPRQPMRA